MLDPTTFLRELVAVPSVSFQERDAVTYLVNQMSELGYVAHRDEAGNAVGIRENADENGECHRTIMLLGHIDTVPGDIPVKVEDGILYGRGSVDAKGPLATFVVAGNAAKLPSGYRLIVVGAVEEEAATSKGARFVATQYNPSVCVIGEPSNYDAVTLGYKGRLLADLIIRQPMSHTAGAELAVTERGVEWWNKINEYGREYNAGIDSLFNQLMPSLRHIESGSDGLTNFVSLRVGIRLPPGFDADELMAKLGDWAEQVKGENGELQFKTYGYEPAYQSNRRSPLGRVFAAALREHGHKPRFKLKTGTADMNVVGPIWNCPIVAYGPGDSQLDHTPNEHIVLDEYEQAIQILQTALELLPQVLD